MRLAILGGSFNPPHKGHRILAEAVLEAGYDRILFVPAYIPPHKALSGDPGPEARLEMTKLAVCGAFWAEVSDCEIRRAGISYSIDTVEYVARNYSFEGKAGLVIGDDLAEGFVTWKKAEELARQADILIARRQPGRVTDFPYPCRFMENPFFPLSSTQLRQLLREGKKCDDLLEPAVLDYIRKRHLYGISAHG